MNCKSLDIFLINSTLWSKVLLEKLVVAQLSKKFSAAFLEPEGSSPCSQEPATGPYPELDKSKVSHGGEYEDDCLP
jgi:hypothetical protein